MGIQLSPFYNRLKKRYPQFPTSCGIYLDVVQGGESGFAWLKGRKCRTATFSDEQELKQMLDSSYSPHVAVVSTGTEVRVTQRYFSILRLLNEEQVPIVTTELTPILQAFTPIDGLTPWRWLEENGIRILPTPSLTAFYATVTALTGYFFLNDEFEFLPELQSVVPLLLENNPLFTYLRQIPYGEVTTFAELAKLLGLHWNEKRVMAELSRLPGGAEVFGHRVVNRDGNVSEFYPEGKELQRDLLKWEMVPFLNEKAVDLKLALWTKQKYRNLTNYLRHVHQSMKFIELTFNEIEKILGFPLPRAARRLGSWWDDEMPHAYIWQGGGCRLISVNMQRQAVAFSRKETAESKGK
ncbi:MAG: MGMT family protein [Clostridiales bacterium]|jgi:alkylated DNA nucleotide flippase Atl1|nr:MGMT family protein [Clostridiales bacterium]